MGAVKYALGVDYGSLSGRAVLVNLTTGEEIATAIHPYPHAVMDACLPDRTTRLPHDFALQHPQDYLDVLSVTIPAVLRQSGVNPVDVVGVGIDFTSCTVLPVAADGTPLCFLPEMQSSPHAYVKLWKHHAAQEEANRINAVAASRGEPWLPRYGGKVSSEWMMAKVWETLNKAPEVYEAADRFMEAADWIVLQLTGETTRNACSAGYKAFWHKRDGSPTAAFFHALDPRLEHVVDHKLGSDVHALGSRAGGISAQAAQRTGLCAGTAVAVANVDAHVAVPAVGITGPGQMLMIMGTSICHMLMGTEEKAVPGICGVVEDGILPGLYGYEAGQTCVGDLFEWFVRNAVPSDYTLEAASRDISIHQLLREKAMRLHAGESGLIALDWWNGNRSVLVDADLSGLILGMSLQTRPEEIYRALIESTAYGTRTIIETFEASGVPITSLFAAGGIAEKDELMMQIYADVCQREIRIAGSPQTPALGAAMFGAVAAGQAQGGFDTIVDAARVLGKVKERVYRPKPEHVRVYDQLFAEYRTLHDWFGRGANDVMKRLKQIRQGST